MKLPVCLLTCAPLLAAICGIGLLPVAVAGSVEPVGGSRTDSVHTVQEGDTLLGLADRLLDRTDHYTPIRFVEAIRLDNGLEGDFLRLGQTLRLTLSSGPASPVRVLPPPDEVRGIYVNASVAGSERVVELARQLREVGGNAVVFDIKDRPGMLSYRSAVPLADSIRASAGAPIARPRRLVEMLHREGIYVVARLTCFYDQRLAQRRPDLVPTSRASGEPWRQRGQLCWVDPSLPEVQDYLLAIVDEVAALGVDEIQLDYVRFPTEGNVADAVFSFPDSVSRDQVITRFVKRVHERLPGGYTWAGPRRARSVRLSADVFGIVAWGREADLKATGQRVADMLRHLDVVSPMLYPSHFYGHFEGMDVPAAYPYYFLYQGCRSLLPFARRNGVAIRPWVQAFPYRVESFDRDYIAEQIRGAEDGGAQGWLLWNSAMQYELGLGAIDDVVNGGVEAGSGRWLRHPAAPDDPALGAADAGSKEPEQSKPSTAGESAAPLPAGGS